jgi:hypothetical protein
VTGRQVFRLTVIIWTIVLLAGRSHAQKSCDEVFQELWKDKPSNTAADFMTGVEHTLSPATSIECAREYLQGYALAAFRPTRQNLFRALENYSNQQQQTSTTSSTASVSPVSKPTGPSAIAEEFSGVNVTSGTSALTFQVSPGSLLSNFEQQGVVLPCSPVLRIAENCLPGFWSDFAERITLSVSANTSVAGQSVKGTATSSISGSTTAGAMLSTTGSSEPSFGGFGVKGVAIYAPPSKQIAKITPAQQKLYQELSITSAELQNQLISCSSFDGASMAAASVLATQSTEDAFLKTLHAQYALLGQALMSCLKSDDALVKRLQDYIAAVLIATTIDKDIAATRKPMVGFEYDLNTPQNQPSYSSLKGNFTLAFGESKSAKEARGAETKAAGSVSCAAAASGQGTASPPIAQAACAAAVQSITLADTKTQNRVAKKTASVNTPLVTVNLSLAGDLYNGKPPSMVPSTERLRDFQGGAEIDLKVTTSKIPTIGSLIGDSTLAGTYYYQDQTSPSVLKGPPSSITLVNLPSTATQVYTTRGPINLGQIRYGFGTGSNVSFPICFTYANRSELITHPIKGLQFGLSYNLSSLFTNSSKSTAGGANPSAAQ